MMPSAHLLEWLEREMAGKTENRGKEGEMDERQRGQKEVLAVASIRDDMKGQDGPLVVVDPP